MDLIQPVFERVADTQWLPRPYARGPFEGVQGGIVAGLMCAAVEEEVGVDFAASAITAQFLKPVPLEILDVEVTIVRRSRRIIAADARIVSGGELKARSIVTLTSALDIPELTESPATPVDPKSFAERPVPSRHGGPWLMDKMETRLDPEGFPWFRFDHPVTGQESAFARLLAPADWTPGISRPDNWENPIVRGCPNVDLTVHVDRPPVSGWIGVSSQSRWRRRGTGLATAKLYDAEGEIGIVSSTVILVP